MKQVMNLEALRSAYLSGERFKYLFFWGHQPSKDGTIGPFVFSQWWPSSFTIEGVRYPSAEHYMMAEKARLFADDDIRQQIFSARSPAAAKALGRQVRNFDQSVWEKERFNIVVRGSVAKFCAAPEMREYLLSTKHRILVEASPRDRIWGIGLAKSNPDAENPVKWRGLNLLGFALMEARAQLV